jgi:hypothetical protein
VVPPGTPQLYLYTANDAEQMMADKGAVTRASMCSPSHSRSAATPNRTALTRLNALRRKISR